MMIEDIDIPEATREHIETVVAPKSPLPLLIGGGLVVSAIALSGVWFLNRSNSPVPPTPVTQQPQEKKVVPAKTTPPKTTETKTTETETTTTASESTPKPAKTEPEPIDNVLGHLPYKQANPNDLVPITSDGRIRLHKAAAKKFRQMEADARAQGIRLAIISGFRSVDTQDYLFFDIKEQRVQGVAKRAEVSAPPGYSEHHTGYVVDLGDAKVPATHLSPKFEHTAAFKWLEKNAAKYSFELSFPRDNPQGISYEPWHWRFVGDRKSLETFYRARNLK